MPDSKGKEIGLGDTVEIVRPSDDSYSGKRGRVIEVMTTTLENIHRIRETTTYQVLINTNYAEKEGTKGYRMQYLWCQDSDLRVVWTGNREFEEV